MHGELAAPGSLRPKQEVFAQRYAALGNAAKAYREAFEVSPGTRSATVAQRAYELVHEPAVAARVREILAQAAEGTTISARARMVRLQAISEADPGELVRIERVPCSSCWPAEAAQDGPNENCAGCRGYGEPRMVLAPTDALSGSARMLLKAVRRKSDGSIEVVLHDQLQAIDILNRMQGSYAPERSLALSAHVDVDFSKMTLEQQADFIRSLAPR